MGWMSASAGKAIKDYRQHKEAQMRRPPILRVTHEPLADRQPTVFYLSPDANGPVGGIRTIYRHVDALNAMGIPSAVVHHRPGFSCTWFQNKTRVVSAPEITLTPADTLVVPEFYGRWLTAIPAGPRVIMFNQNTYRTFSGPRPVGLDSAYPDVSRLEAILVVSQDNAEYARYAFGQVAVECVRNAIDDRLFHASETSPGRRLAVMPRKRGADCQQVLDLLELRGVLKQWEVLVIDNLSEQETADELRSSAIFLSFSEQEGFGMPPAEAMACGCYVVGFTGLAGREYFDPDVCSPVEEGNTLALARAAESAILSYERDKDALRDRALIASARILSQYSAEAQIADLKIFFGNFLSV